MTVAIIAATTGSGAGLFLETLAGRRLFLHVIAAAKQAGGVDQIVFVSPDAGAIEVAANAGAIGVAVSAEDVCTPTAALRQGLRFVEESRGLIPEMAVLISAAAPGLIATDIDGVVESLMEAGEGAMTAVGVTAIEAKLWNISPDAPEWIVNAGDGGATLCEAGALYAIRSAKFLASGDLFAGGCIPYLLPKERALVARDSASLEEARIYWRRQTRRERMDLLPELVDGIAFDFDGVFTDNGVFVTEDGIETVYCSRGDGLGINHLAKSGIPMIVLSKEKNPVVSARCRKLGLECIQGLDTKVGILSRWITERGLDAGRVIYVGNDINDLECMAAVGCPVAPADAHPSALAAARIVLECSGGRGALRELADMALERRQAARESQNLR